MSIRERALDHKCPSCGAKIVFSPSIGKWKCDHCGSEFDLETLKKYNNASSDENNTKSNETINTEYLEYNCKNCGAKIIADEQTAATFCVYCGNTAILKSKLSGKFAPSKIIPFSKTKEEALEAFKSLNKGRPLMPKFFNKKENIEKISGVYIPFWLYDAKSEGVLESKSSRITTWNSADYSYTKTDNFAVSRDVTLNYNKIPVDASKRFADDIMNTIEPFDYDKLVDYYHAYLSGFLAEKYDVESEIAKKIALKRVDQSTKELLMDSISQYTTNKIKKENIKTDISDTKYVLLPVWMVNVKYGGKYYTFAMNAQTGEFVGDIPIDKRKAVLYSVMIFIFAFIITTFIAYLIFIGG